MFFDEEEIEVEEETEEADPEDARGNLREKNFKQIPKFLDYWRKKQSKPKQLTLSFKF
jgi:hypothetical protein